ncbi:hypothetical protein GGI17_006115 [Coemansia sp. S146]|nr:hypothetical protein GGI17_006115 [Coemansia sp. S146]
MTVLTRFWPVSQARYSTKTKTRPALSFQQFIQRGQVISMYRKYMRLTKQIPDKPSRRELREWIRGDFDRYRTESDPRRVD